MPTNPLTALAALVFFVIVFVLGFLLYRSGKPYNILVLTMHKLVSLAMLILFVLTVVRVNRTTPLIPPVLLAVVVAVAFFVAAIVSGGLVSIDRPTPPIVRGLHWLTPFLTIAGVAVTSILLS